MVVTVLLKHSFPKNFKRICTNESGGVLGVCIPHRVGQLFLEIYPIRRGGLLQSNQGNMGAWKQNNLSISLENTEESLAVV